MEKETTNGTQTDFDGAFSLSINDKNSTLVVSYIGYKTQEISVDGQSSINITLLEDAAALDEIVVVGYGSVKKENLTGAVESISSEQIENNIGPNTSQILQGVAPNLNITLDNGGINEEANIDIRGVGSIKVIEVEVVHELRSVIATLYVPAERFVISSVVAVLLHKYV